MDLNRAQFDVLAQGLYQIARAIPDKWGHVQNNAYDDELKDVCDIFAVQSLEELNEHIGQFDVDHQQYYKKRWFATKCADCDEYLFYRNDNIVHNPNRFDKKWDIRINNHIQFDVKGTVIPAEMRDDYKAVLADPSDMIKFFYDKQSRGVRYDMQNRLFIVHHSLTGEDRSKRIRACWGIKEKIYERYAQEAENIEFKEYEGCLASVIFIVETEPGVIKYKIDGLDNDLVTI